MHSVNLVLKNTENPELLEKQFIKYCDSVNIVHKYPI